MAEKVGARIVVSGVVQGVGFRFFTVNLARRLGLRGWVKNKPDGTVEIRAEGDKPAMFAFINELRIGPRWATVRDVNVQWTPPEDSYHSFDIVF